jgi:predicted NBD/HSP70 family sugar kinase
MNLRFVLRTIREHGPLSRSDLRRHTGLSRPTLDEVVTHLLSLELLLERPATDEELATRRPGPRPRYLAFNSDCGRLIGIDIGAEKVIVIATDLDGRIIRRLRTQVRGFSREALVKEVRKLLADAANTCRKQRKSVRAVVIGTPGIIDPSSGSISFAPQISGWEGIVLRDELLQGYNCATAVENEMHLAVLGEHWLGTAADFDDVVYIGIGIGVSAGLIIDGALRRGASGAAGEIGYLNFGFSDEGAGLGGGGWFERSVGARAFTPMTAGTGTATGESGPAVIFRAAAAGDPSALSLIDQVASVLARGVATLALTLNPALIVLGGGLSGAGEALRSPVQSHLDHLFPMPAPLLRVSTLGEDATVLGAVYRARELSNEVMYQEVLSSPDVLTAAR